MKTITIYSKFCTKCLWEEELLTIESYCQNKKIKLEICRTTLDDNLHRVATELWGNSDYKAFVADDDGKIMMEITEFAKKCKNKLLKPAKAKKARARDDE